MRVSRRVLRDRVEALGAYALQMEAWSRGEARKPIGRPFTLEEYREFHRDLRWYRRGAR